MQKVYTPLLIAILVLLFGTHIAINRCGAYQACDSSDWSATVNAHFLETNMISMNLDIPCQAFL